MSWLQLSVAVVRDRVERAADLLSAHGAAAVSLSGAGEDELLEPLPGEQPLWDQVRLDALLPPDADLKKLRAALGDEAVRLLDVTFVGDQDWQASWRAHAVRACFGGRLWLLPRDEPFELVADQAADRPAVLRLDPGLAFGSGSHPTTRLCLGGLTGLDLTGCKVLDYGCGSGVLALAACLLGAGEVVAVDHDPQALIATRDNAAGNAVGHAQLRVMTPEDLDGPGTALDTFDVVVANILASPLVALASRLTARIRPGGRLLLSGLLESQDAVIRAAYPGVVFDAPVREAQWIRLDGRRAA